MILLHNSNISWLVCNDAEINDVGKLLICFLRTKEVEIMQFSDTYNTEIIATMGTTLCTVRHVITAVNNGVKNFRVHMGVRTDHCLEYFVNARKAEKYLNKKNCILIDLPTEKTRAGNIKTSLTPIIGEKYSFIPAVDVKSMDGIPIKGLEKYIMNILPGHRIVFSDGKIIFKVTGLTDNKLIAECIFTVSDIIPNISSCVFPDSDVEFNLFRENDICELECFKQNGLRPDWVAVSFAEESGRILEVKKTIASIWDSDVKIMAKIETKKGIENVDQIIKCADGIMVARGDMMAYIEPYCMPYLQSLLVKKARYAKKPVVVATEMLEQFASSGLITRPELSDIALAFRQGATAVMLSVESSNCVRAMDCIKLMNQILSYERRQLNE